MTAQLTLTRKEMEVRRLAAVGKLRRGFKPRDIARDTGVSRTTVYRWLNLDRDGKDLRARKSTGCPSKMSARQRQQLLLRFENGATVRELHAFIRQTFLVEYDSDYVRRRMSKWGIPVKWGGMGPQGRRP